MRNWRSNKCTTIQRKIKLFDKGVVQNLWNVATYWYRLTSLETYLTEIQLPAPAKRMYSFSCCPIKLFPYILITFSFPANLAKAKSALETETLALTAAKSWWQVKESQRRASRCEDCYGS